MNEDILIGLDRFTVGIDYEPRVRQCLIKLCDYDHCAAMLLDLFYAETQMNKRYWESETAKEYLQKYPEAQTEADDNWVHRHMNDYVTILGYLFDEDRIYDAAVFLAKEGWVDLQLTTMKEFGQAISFRAHINVIEDALEKQIEKRNQLREEISEKERLREEIVEEIRRKQESQIEAQERRVREIRKEVAKEVDEQVQRDRREMRRIAQHISQAKARGLSATLTLTQWLETLNYFSWKCAYCHGSYEVLEHFLPVSLNGGTIQSNCVPACLSCNSRKNNKHPSSLHREMGDCIEQIQQYLSQFEHSES